MKRFFKFLRPRGQLDGGFESNFKGCSTTTTTTSSSTSTHPTMTGPAVLCACLGLVVAIVAAAIVSDVCFVVAYCAGDGEKSKVKPSTTTTSSTSSKDHLYLFHSNKIAHAYRPPSITNQTKAKKSRPRRSHVTLPNCHVHRRCQRPRVRRSRNDTTQRRRRDRQRSQQLLEERQKSGPWNGHPRGGITDAWTARTVYKPVRSSIDLQRQCKEPRCQTLTSSTSKSFRNPRPRPSTGIISSLPTVLPATTGSDGDDDNPRSLKRQKTFHSIFSATVDPIVVVEDASISSAAVAAHAPPPQRFVDIIHPRGKDRIPFDEKDCGNDIEAKIEGVLKLPVALRNLQVEGRFLDDDCGDSNVGELGIAELSTIRVLRFGRGGQPNGRGFRLSDLLGVYGTNHQPQSNKMGRDDSPVDTVVNGLNSQSSRHLQSNKRGPDDATVDEMVNSLYSQYQDGRRECLQLRCEVSRDSLDFNIVSLVCSTNVAVSENDIISAFNAIPSAFFPIYDIHVPGGRSDAGIRIRFTEWNSRTAQAIACLLCRSDEDDFMFTGMRVFDYRFRPSSNPSFQLYIAIFPTMHRTMM